MAWHTWDVTTRPAPPSSGSRASVTLSVHEAAFLPCRRGGRVTRGGGTACACAGRAVCVCACVRMHVWGVHLHDRVHVYACCPDFVQVNTTICTSVLMSTCRTHSL